jgi:hypothetical protein
MKTKEEVLESYFGSDYFLLKERDDLQYILRAMDEYAHHFKQAGINTVLCTVASEGSDTVVVCGQPCEGDLYEICDDCYERFKKWLSDERKSSEGQP